MLKTPSQSNSFLIFSDVMSCLLYFSGRLYDPDRPLLLCSFGMAFYFYNEEDKDFKTKSLGSKKVSSGSPTQVDFLAGQVTFKVYLSNRQGLKRVPTWRPQYWLDENLMYLTIAHTSPAKFLLEAVAVRYSVGFSRYASIMKFRLARYLEENNGYNHNIIQFCVGFE